MDKKIILLICMLFFVWGLRGGIYRSTMWKQLRISYRKLKNFISQSWHGYLDPTAIHPALIGMRGDTFISLSFLDQILSAEFLSKNSKLFCRWKLTSIGLIGSLSLIKIPIGGNKDEHFSCFHSSCQWGLRMLFG